MNQPCEKYKNLKMPGCPCNELQEVRLKEIAAGLSQLPRQIATFPEFRQAMLAAIRKYPALSSWRARKEDDLGVMLLEMWAYICDNLSFYDEVIAHESYIRTARLRPSLRKIVRLISYLPKPAVAANIKLAAFAEGRNSVTLPVGTSFRSSSFDNQAPQVFELLKEVVIHPLTNQWAIEPPRSSYLLERETIIRDSTSQIERKISTSSNQDELDKAVVNPQIYGKEAEITSTSEVFEEQHTLAEYASINGTGYLERSLGKRVSSITLSDFLDKKVLLLTPSLEIPPGSWMLIKKATSDILKHQAIKVEKVEFYTGTFEEPFTILSLQTEISNFFFPALLSQISLGLPIQEVALWTKDSSLRSVNIVGQNTELVLDGLYSLIKRGDFVLVTGNDTGYSMLVKEVHIVPRESSSGNKVIINNNTFEIPGIKMSVTQLVLEGDLSDWVGDEREIRVHFDFRVAGKIINEAKTPLRGTIEKLNLSDPVEKPSEGYRSNRFLAEDKNQQGLEITGEISFLDKQFNPGKNTNKRWPRPFYLPVNLFGNIIEANRGEQVRGEVLGSGDASVVFQSFKLKKKPLTYVHSPTADNDQGVKSTLEVFVDGLRWKETPNFYGKQPTDEVYILRQDDDDETLVIFGDGIRGQRLPTGLNNVIASYRFGAGAAAPPAGSVTQIGKPVKGLRSIKNLLPGYGGADAETGKEIRKAASKSALLLGRAVSIFDMEAVVLSFPGVKAVQADWRWHRTRQIAVVHIWYAGEDYLESSIFERLQNLTDRSIPFQVEQAQQEMITMKIDIKIDSRLIIEDVENEVSKKLLQSETGILIVENLGIGRPLYRSRIFEEVLVVEGVMAVRRISWKADNQTSTFNSYAMRPESGHYFEFKKDLLVINGTSY